MVNPTMPNKPSRVKIVQGNYQIPLSQLRDFGFHVGDEVEVVRVEPVDAPRPVNASVVAITIKPVKQPPRIEEVFKDLLGKVPPDRREDPFVKQALWFAAQNNLQITDWDIQRIVSNPKKWVERAKVLVNLGLKDLRQRQVYENGGIIAVHDLYAQSLIMNMRFRVGVSIDDLIASVGVIFTLPIVMGADSYYEVALNSLVHQVLYPRREYMESSVRELLERVIIPEAMKRWREYQLGGN